MSNAQASHAEPKRRLSSSAVSLQSHVHCNQKRPMHCLADLRVGLPCHCRRTTRLTHPMRVHLTIWLHAKRTSKPRRAKASSVPFYCLIAITRALLPEASNALLGGSESWLALPLPPDNAPHSPHASTPHHLVACQTNKQATQSQSVVDALLSAAS